MWQSCRLRFARDHPAGAGHFPANPIIPGALLLDEMLATVLGGEGERAVTIRSAKFLHIVRPGEQVELRWQTLGGGEIKFECRHENGDSLVMSGMLERRESPP